MKWKKFSKENGERRFLWSTINCERGGICQRLMILITILFLDPSRNWIVSWMPYPLQEMERRYCLKQNLSSKLLDCQHRTQKQGCPGTSWFWIYLFKKKITSFVTSWKLDLMPSCQLCISLKILIRWNWHHNNTTTLWQFQLSYLIKLAIWNH